jgi:hypothetical protein
MPQTIATARVTALEQTAAAGIEVPETGYLCFFGNHSDGARFVVGAWARQRSVPPQLIERSTVEVPQAIMGNDSSHVATMVNIVKQLPVRDRYACGGRRII